MEEMKALILGEPITLEDFVSVARFGRKVEFSPEYAARVDRSRALVERRSAEHTSELQSLHTIS